MQQIKRRKPAVKKKKVKESPPACPKCWHAETIRSGMVQGQQRWKCKECGYQYTRTAPRGRPLWQKSLAVFLHSQHVPLQTIGGIFHVQPSTVLKWVQTFAKDNYGMPEAGDVHLMDITDIQRHLKKFGAEPGMLCIAIKDTTFKKSLGITVSELPPEK